MYEHYWGLTSTPFTNRFTHQVFYESPIHEEALARLFYCVEQCKTLAVFHGPKGCGKSHVLQRLAHQVRRSQRFFVQTDIGNLSESDFLRQLIEQLRLTEHHDGSLSRDWQILGDFCQATCESDLQTVLVFEGLEDAEDSVLSAIKRLVHLQNQSAAHVTIITSLGGKARCQSLGDLLELADMGIEVQALGQAETDFYVQNRLEKCGSQRAVFQPDAIEQLHQLTGGVPREINRLCDLALLAGMNESRSTIDRELIASLTGERNLPVISTSR